MSRPDRLPGLGISDDPEVRQCACMVSSWLYASPRGGVGAIPPSLAMLYKNDRKGENTASLNESQWSTV